MSRRSAALRTSRIRPVALGYVRVSTAEQADSGAGLAAQEVVLADAAARAGWDLTVVTDAGVSAKGLDRPGLVDTLAALDRGDADVLVVAKLDRLSRSVHDFTGLLGRAERNGWQVVCLDVGVDTTTTSGNMVAGVLSVMAEFERRLIGDRTRAALAAKQAAGVRLGRPQGLPLNVVARIVNARAAGATLTAIAAMLTAEAVPRAQGGARWHASTIAAVLRSQAARSLVIV